MTRNVQTHPVYRIEDVGDGDTITAILDLGVDNLQRARLRLVTVDCPERGDEPGWTNARTFTRNWLTERVDRDGPGGTLLHVDLQLTRTGRLQQTFGRWMADVYDAGTGESLSGALLHAGLAEVWS